MAAVGWGDGWREGDCDGARGEERSGDGGRTFKEAADVEPRMAEPDGCGLLSSSRPKGRPVAASLTPCSPIETDYQDAQTSGWT